jgi:hypothetical protein
MKRTRLLGISMLWLCMSACHRPIASGVSTADAGALQSSGSHAHAAGAQALAIAGAANERAMSAGASGQSVPDPNVDIDAGSGTSVDAQVVARDEVTPEPSDAATYLFDQNKVRTYNLIIAQSDLDKIGVDPTLETEVPAMLEFEGKTYGPYHARYKGSVGSFRPPCTLVEGGPKVGKCSMKVDFNDLDPNARFFGLEKLNFHTMNGDDSMLHERLGLALFREMGIAAPRSMHARLLINGVLEGLYLVVEQVDGRFSRARFGDGGRGNVYKEIWPIYDDAQLYVNALETNRQPAPNVQRMLDFNAAIADSAQAAQKFFDRDYMMRYIAVDRLIINDDGIFHWWCTPKAQGNNIGPYGNHNFYWYEAQDSQRLWLIPWDLDTSFDGYQMNRTEQPWTATAACACNINSQLVPEWPASCDPLTQYFIGWSADYNAQVDAFISGPFGATRIDAKLSAWSNQIMSAVAEASGRNGAPAAFVWMKGIAQLQHTIDDSRKNRGRVY